MATTSTLAVTKPAAAEVSMPLLREMTLDDYEASVALEAANGLKARTRLEWSRMWTENPVYQSLGATFPMGWVLEDEDTGRLVGTLSNIPIPYTLQGRNLLAVTGRGWAVDPAYRAFAGLLLFEYFNQNADLMLSTTVNGNAEASHAIAEQGRAPVGDWHKAAFRITNYNGFAKVALRLKKVPLVPLWSPFVAAGLWLKDRLTAPPLPAGPHDVTVTVRHDFPEYFDDFWAELLQLKSDKLMGVRSRKVLQWHFGAAKQQGKLRVISAFAGDKMVAYAVLVRADHRDSGLTRWRVADCQSLREDPPATAALLRKAVEICENEGIDVLEVVGCGLPTMRTFEGAAPYRRNLPAWCYFYLAPEEALMQTLADPKVWEPSSFDGDSSI